MRKISVSLFLFFLIVMLLAGCNKTTSEVISHDQEQERVSEEYVEVEKEESTTSNEKIIIDDLGYEVVLPKEINRIVIADLPPLVHAYYVANGSVEGLVGAPENNALVDTMLPIVYPEVKNISTGFRDGNTVNMEEMLSLMPDVIFYRSDNEQTGEQMRNSGVPAVAFQTFNGDNGNTVSAVTSWLRMLAVILDKEEKSEEIIENAFQTLGFVQSRMWDIKEEDKVRMIYFSNATKEQLRASGEGLFGTFWATISGAKDVTVGDFKGGKELSMEQLYNYNPEVIFLVFSSLTPDDIYNDPNFADIDAVKNKRVYEAPLGIFTWYGPSTDVPLSFLWHAKMLYPEAFSDVDVVAETIEYYKNYYGYDLTDEDIKFLFRNSLEVLNGATN